jgi:hypothetical protein
MYPTGPRGKQVLAAGVAGEEVAAADLAFLQQRGAAGGAGIVAD